jgi:hypothetical protein
LPPPGITYPTSVSFPRQAPSDFSRRIETGIDTALQAPVHDQISLAFQRQFGGGMLFEASYVGRLARNLLASRDVMALNDLRDPKSGMDWYTAATMLEKQRQLGARRQVFSPFRTSIIFCQQDSDANNAPKLFGCDTVAAYHSYRPAYPGETGPRNVLRRRLLGSEA